MDDFDDFDKLHRLDSRFRQLVIVLVLFAIILFVSLYARGAEPVAYVAIRVSEVIDGDTIRGDVILPWRVVLENRVVRCSDYDAWECTKRRRSVVVTDEECRKGVIAKSELMKLFEKSHGIYLVQAKERDGVDNYGRLLAKVYVHVPGEKELLPLADWARQNNHVRSKK